MSNENNKKAKKEDKKNILEQAKNKSEGKYPASKKKPKQDDGNQSFNSNLSL